MADPGGRVSRTSRGLKTNYKFCDDLPLATGLEANFVIYLRYFFREIELDSLYQLLVPAIFH